ncbi:family 1 glycosyltransferase [Pseudomassariella vexata]|uniref:Family 1 glycosyltransferase n=1 Tax=Pseudomassariella vexata TaxID=1141098 RepID=A0A1Y2EIG9_9PEZI|nr:family 1 glycosyltransferase [Pseudomassariella vexata]ORY71026.1 family 1 glycosyltransferase [Pseudomassariella vexata]
MLNKAFKYAFAISGVLGTLIGILSTWLTAQTLTVPPIQQTQGKKGTVLFFINEEYGLTNVHLDTAQALLEHHPSVTIHVASFPEATKRGIGNLARAMPIFALPWSAEDHLNIYHAAMQVLLRVDPAVVVLDTYMTPAIDATRQANYVHTIIESNSMIHAFYLAQPYWSMFWKYPMLGTGFTYPVPWRQIPENIYVTARLVYSFLFDPHAREKRKYLQEHGIANPASYNLHRPDVPWFTRTMFDAGVRPEVVPANVTGVGPIILGVAPAIEQDLELVEWLSKTRTVLVNLGTLFTHNEERATVMAEALEILLLEHTKVQVLWKLQKCTDFPDDFARSLKEYGDRIRITEWLAADPLALLETGHIVASANHGGSSCFHEAIAAGVPQIIIPFWTDLYDFARTAEDSDIGVFATKDTAPQWTVEGLSEAFLRVVHGKESSRMRKNTRRLSAIAKKNRGRYVTAREIAKLAGST